MSKRISKKDTFAINYLKAKTARGGDKYEELEEYDSSYYEPFVCDWLAKQGKLIGVAYRGYIASSSWLQDKNFCKGALVSISDISNTPFPEFTTSELRACTYATDASLYQVNDDFPVSVLFEVRLSGAHCVDIHEQSVYPEEQACIFDRDVIFKVVDVVQEPAFTRIILIEL